MQYTHCVHTRTNTHTKTHTHTHKRTHAHAYKLALKHAQHTHTHKHTHTNTLEHAHACKHAHTLGHVGLHARSMGSSKSARTTCYVPRISTKKRIQSRCGQEAGHVGVDALSTLRPLED